MNKKGSATKFTLEMMTKFLGITLVGILAIIMIFGYYSGYELDTSGIRAKVLMSRIMYSDAINYVSDERSYTGVIDMKKFNTESLEDSINYTSDYIAAAKLSLLGPGGQEVQKAYLNERRFNAWAPLAKTEVEGPGSAKIFTEVFPVTARVKEGDFRMFLKVEVVTQ